MKKITLSIMLAILMLACGQSKIETLIADHEQNFGGTITDLSFKAKEVKLIGSWSTLDSAAVYASRIDSIKAIYFKGENIDSISSYSALDEIDSMAVTYRRMYESFGDIMYLKHERQWVQNKMNFLNLMENHNQFHSVDTPLYNIYECTYTIKNPFLNNAVQTITNKYFITPDESKIVGKESIEM